MVWPRTLIEIEHCISCDVSRIYDFPTSDKADSTVRKKGMVEEGDEKLQVSLAAR
jgi:hypothetical protein